MKKVILTESDKKQILSEREQAIIDNFSKTFDSIKRIDENHGLNPYGFESTLIMNPNKWQEFKDFARLSEIWDQENNITKLYIGQHLVGTYHPKFGRLDYNRGSELDKRAQEFKFDRNR